MDLDANQSEHIFENRYSIYNLKMQIIVRTGIRHRDYVRNDSIKKSTELLDPCFFSLSEVVDFAFDSY